MPAYNYYNDPYMYATPQSVQGQYQQVYKPQFQSPIINSNLVFVRGEQAAMAYPQAPSTKIVIWDQDVNVFYEKTTDAQGNVIDFSVNDYTKREKSEIQNGNSEIDEQIKSLNAKIDALTSIVNSQSSSKESSYPKTEKIQKRTKEVSVDAKSDV